MTELFPPAGKWDCAGAAVAAGADAIEDKCALEM